MNDTVKFAWKVNSEADTVQFAYWVAKRVKAGTVIALDGNLGAGKTRFSQAFAQALGVTEVVNSPTFTIIKEYKGIVLPVYHMDVYRISLGEADELGLDEYFYGDGVCLVEWANRITPLLPTCYVHLFIQMGEQQQRTMRLIAYGEPYIYWLDELKQTGV